MLAIIKLADDLDRIAERKVKIDQTRLGATESDIERKCESARQSRLSPRTVQRHQQTISSVLDFAVQKGKLGKNVMKDLVFTDQMLKNAAKGQEDNGRKLWNAEFAKLLATPHWQEPNKRIVDALYWAPIIAFLHGMRSEEILQLKPSDVKSENGIHFFDLRQGEDQALKSASARRSIPLHKGLLELGFLKLVAHQEDAGEDRIFTDIRRTRSAKQNFTAMFTKFSLNNPQISDFMQNYGDFSRFVLQDFE